MVHSLVEDPVDAVDSPATEAEGITGDRELRQ
jgi:hypothetical protein